MQKLQELAESAGISSSYVDKTGITHYTTDDVRRFFLKNMGYFAETETEIERSLKILRKQRLLPFVMSFFEDEKIEFVELENDKKTDKKDDKIEMIDL